jgi:hypothetical protein
LSWILRECGGQGGLPSAPAHVRLLKPSFTVHTHR